MKNSGCVRFNLFTSVYNFSSMSIAWRISNNNAIKAMIQVAFEKHQNIPETTWIIALIGSLLLMHPVINEIKILSGQYILPEKDHSSA